MLSHEESKELLALCRSGKLYEVEKWIKSGASLSVSGCRETPLQVAVDKSFHSLVELLVKHEPTQEVKDRALLQSVLERKKELVALLINHGASIKAIPFSDVLLSWDPDLIRMFLSLGADVITDSPFAQAFGARIRTALRPFLQYRQDHPELAENLVEQANQALRYFCHEGDLKWVSLLIWAGADPRKKGRKLHEDDDPEGYTTALQEACYRGHVELIKKLKPDPSKDDLPGLLNCAAYSSKREFLRYFLELGANPNDKSNGGSSALQHCLWHLNWEGTFNQYGKNRIRSKYDVRESLGCIDELVSHGARWVPEDKHQLDSLRRTLYTCEPAVTIQLLDLFVKHQACSLEAIRRLLSTPRMQAHLAADERKLSRIGVPLRDPKTHKKPELPQPSYELLSRYNREELYQKAWSRPMQTLAKEYGISDVGLAKVCRKLRVPVPGRGYWAKKSAGRRVPKMPVLPVLKPSSK